MMKAKISYLLLVLATGLTGVSRMSPKPAEFVATSPCDQIPRAMLAIPATVDCEMIKWELALHHDPRNQQPTRYQLNYTYGMSKPSTTNFTNDGTQGTKMGEWTVLNDSPTKTVYRLQPVGAGTAISFVRLDENLLHLLDPDGRLMIGHAGWSYTLNRK